MSTSARGGLRSRRKGKRGERELVRLARQHGHVARRTWQTAQADGPVARQCDVSVAGRTAQVKVAARGFDRLYQMLDGVEVAFVRQDHKPWLAIVPATDLLDMFTDNVPMGSGFECAFCSSRFCRFIDYDAHVQVAHPTFDSYFCDFCRRAFRAYATLEAHLERERVQKVHGPDRPAPHSLER